MRPALMSRRGRSVSGAKGPRQVSVPAGRSSAASLSAWVCNSARLITPPKSSTRARMLGAPPAVLCEVAFN
jgi:hypothetical protein